MSKIEVDAIDKQSGSTLTLGGSGTAVTLACGATQSGFGRSGSVNWQTTIKTATFTAASGEGYFCNTSGGAFTVNLPSSPSVGDIVAIKDYGSSFNDNALTIGRGGSNMNGSASDSIRNTENESLTMVYADATKGWLAVEEGTGFIGEAFITATGGTITTSGNCKIHTFTSPGTFCVANIATTAANNAVAYMVIAGGGGGGPVRGGGGGAGGFREGRTNPITPYTASPLAAACSGLTITQSAFPITVGAGGSGGASGGNGNPTACATIGAASVFSSITSTGGGFGTTPAPSPNAASPGGSGGGGNNNTSSGTSNGGTGNTPPVSPPQGNPGGVGVGAPKYGAGGGGGATVTGVGGNTSGDGGDGGAGATTSINATPTTRAGGGGGAAYDAPAGFMGCGGAGGGGPAGGSGESGGTAGTTNTGSGGGGAWHPGPATEETAGNGGSGIVIIRYKFQ